MVISNPWIERPRGIAGWFCRPLTKLRQILTIWDDRVSPCRRFRNQGIKRLYDTIGASIALVQVFIVVAIDHLIDRDVAVKSAFGRRISQHCK